MQFVKQDYKCLADQIKQTNYGCPIQSYLLLSRLIQEIPDAQDQQTLVLQDVLKKTHHLSDSQLWYRVNYLLWTKETENPQFKRMSIFYSLLTNWISFYEEKLSKVEHNQRCFIELSVFLRHFTNCHIERHLLIEQCLDDIKSVITFSGYWEDVKYEDMLEVATYDNLQGLLNVLQLLIYRSDIFVDGKGIYEIMDMVKVGKSNYDIFVFRSLNFLLKHPKMVFKHELQLTKLVIKFSAMCKQEDSIELMRQLLHLTSKPVKFACMCDYQTLGLLVQSKGKQQLQEALQNIHEYRELTMKRVELGSIDTEPLNIQHKQILVARGQTFQTHFQIIRPKSLLIVQFQLDQTIDVTLSFEGNLTSKDKNTYFHELKCTSRSLHIQINDCGLHCLTFGNTFSWVNSKKIRYSIITYMPMAQENHDFASLLV